MSIFLFVCRNIDLFVPLAINFYTWIKEQANSDDPRIELKNFIEAVNDGFRTKDPTKLERFFNRKL